MDTAQKLSEGEDKHGVEQTRTHTADSNTGVAILTVKQEYYPPWKSSAILSRHARVAYDKYIYYKVQGLAMKWQDC